KATTAQPNGATLLQDGRTIVVGVNTTGVINSNIYDPATNTWSASKTLYTPGAASRPNNFAGALTTPDGYVVFVNSRDPQMWIYSPLEDTWRQYNLPAFPVGSDSYPRMLFVDNGSPR